MLDLQTFSRVDGRIFLNIDLPIPSGVIQDLSLRYRWIGHPSAKYHLSLVHENSSYMAVGYLYHGLT